MPVVRRQTSSERWDGDDECAPLTRGALHPSAPAVALGDVLDQSEADAAAAHGGPELPRHCRAPRPRPRAADEAPRRCALARPAGTPGPLSVTRMAIESPSKRALGWSRSRRSRGVLQRVVHEVDDRELDRALVDARRRQAGLDLDRELDAVALGAVAVGGSGLRRRRCRRLRRRTRTALRFRDRPSRSRARSR